MPAPLVVVPPTASWLRRIGALVLDWLACWCTALVVLGPARFFGDSAAPNLVVPALFVIESTMLGCTLGGSFGQLLLRLRVVRTDGSGRWLDPVRMLARQLLVLLVIPPLIFRPDGRGLHDILCGTATVPRAAVPRPVGERG